MLARRGLLAISSLLPLLRFELTYMLTPSARRASDKLSLLVRGAEDDVEL
jgi:hypothetical protein